jgi:hypothetical protein
MLRSFTSILSSTPSVPKYKMFWQLKLNCQYVLYLGIEEEVPTKPAVISNTEVSSEFRSLIQLLSLAPSFLMLCSVLVSDDLFFYIY